MMRNKDYSSEVAAAASQFTKEKEYWVKKLSGAPVKSTFPYDFAQSVKSSRQMEREAVKIRFPNELFSKLLWISNQSDARLFMILTAGLVLLLNRYTGDKDITVGMPIYKQHIEGDFINTVLALRCQLTDHLTFKELLYLVKQTIDGAVRNQNYPLKALLYELKLPYSEEDFPLFDIAVMLENIQDRAYIRHIHTNMGFSFLRTGEYLEGIVEYNRALYPEETVESIAAHYILLLERSLADVNEQVSRVDLLSDEERKKLLGDFNHTDSDHSLERTLHGLFEDRVEKAPDGIAVIGGTRCVGTRFIGSVTGRELNEQSNRLAKILKNKGVSPGCITALLMESSLDMAAAIIAILKAGGAYLPIDPEYPEDRINFMLTDSSARVLLKQVSRDIEVIELVKVIGPISPIGPITHGTPTQPCYIIYTSGTTGKPKGVMVEHRGVANTLVCRKKEYDLGTGAICLQLFSHAFDGFVTAFFTPLISGAPVVLMNQRDIKDIEKVNAAIARHRVTHFISVPALYRAIIETITPKQAASLKVVTLAGDKVTPELLAITAEKIPGTEIAIEYGVTEAAVMSTIKRHQERDDTLVIGGPVWNTRLYILNEAFQPQPIGVPGELCISGAGVSRGYLNNPELTTEKFPPAGGPSHPTHPLTHSPLYRTGDLARWLPDGNIEFLGRADNQVKIRGFRIELGEVENTLNRHTAVRDAVVVPEGQNDGQTLTAYVVPDKTRAFTVRQLLTMEKQGLTALHNCGELPNHMPLFYLNRAEIDYMYRENIEELFSWEEKGVTLDRGDVVFDVGANIGLFSLLTHRQYRSRELTFYLFEPIPAINHLLRLNMSLYGIPAKIFQHAVAAAEGESEFTYFPNDSILSGCFPGKQEEIDHLKTIIRSLHLSENRQESMDEYDGLLKDRLRTQSLMCPVKTLSQVIRENRIERIDLLKVDIGKYGLDVLKGIEEEDWPKIRQIAVEIEDIENSLQWVGQTLEQRGYRISVERNQAFDTPALYNIYAVLPPRAAKRPSSQTLDKSGHVPGLFFSPKRLSSELREYAGQTLPHYMVPSTIVLLDELPLTPSGKVDRRVLPGLKSSSVIETYVPPRNRVEEELVETWAEILKVDAAEISTEANFFELGGNSLNATILVARVHQKSHAKIPLIELFKMPTIRELAEYIGAQTVREQHLSIKPVKKSNYYRLSSVQRRLYVLWRMEKENVVYNVPVVLEVEGNIDNKRFEDAFQRLILRHESLRTSFEMDRGEPVQVIHEAVDFKIEALPGPSDHFSQEHVNRDFVQPFDLAKPPLLRVGMLAAGRHQAILLLDMHHIITDGMSMAILVKEFMALYEGSELAPLKIQYKDYAHWQQEQVARGELRQQEEYWKEMFTGTIPVLHLPTDYPRPDIQGFSGDVMRFDLDRKTAASLETLARGQGATLFMLLLAVYYLLLFKLSGQEDIVIGVPIAARRHADLRPLIGMFVNTLALRSQVAGEETFTGFLGRVRERLLKAYENQDYPFEDLVETVLVDRNVDRSPLFDIMFSYGNIDIPEVEIPGLKVTPLPYNGRISRFDLTLIAEEGDKPVFTLEYSTSLFKAETVARFIMYFKRIIASVLREPGCRVSAVDILSEEEKQQLLVDFNDTAADYPREKTIHQLFAEQAARSGDKIAVIDARHRMGPTVTYRELDRESDQLAYLLKEKGVEPDTVVGLMKERSIEMMVGIFGILKAGGAYLPIDPAYPRERIDFMLKDSSAVVLLTNLSEGHHLNCQLSIINYQLLMSSQKAPFHHSSFINHHSSNLAYVIYTSGSTGTPKGVMVEHRSALNTLLALHDRYPFKQTDTYLLKTAYMFDVSITELFGWFLGGGRLVVLETGGEKDPGIILKTISEEHVTHINFVPPMFRAFVDALFALSSQLEKRQINESLTSLKYIFLAGEALTGDVVSRFREINTAIALENIYGPTEAAVYGSWYSLADWNGTHRIPIGKPLYNVQLYVLDRNRSLQPIGVPGELCITGTGIARGYLNQPELTAEKFVPPSLLRFFAPSLPHFSLYHTGDLARWLPNGNIEFLGRMDDQVKIRGFRIELGEIEKQLISSGYLPIKEAVVTAGPGPGGDNRLIAYVVPDDTSAYTVYRQLEVTEQDLVEGLVRDTREYLKTRLPDYMVPAHIVPLARLPLTPNGKIDRNALPEPEVRPGNRYVAPQSNNEREIAGVWKKVLGLEKVGVNDNFFDVGGNSLKIIHISVELKALLGIDIPVAKMFQYPTIASLARYIAKADHTGISRVKEKEREEAVELAHIKSRLKQRRERS